MLWRALRSALKPRATADATVARALALRREGRQAEAESCLRRALRDHPGDPALATNLAVALLEQNRGPEAVLWLERALRADPGFAPAHLNYAHVLRINGRLADAIPHYRAAAYSTAPIPEAHEALMQALLDACDWDGAGALADELRERAARGPHGVWMPCVSPLIAVYLGFGAEQCKAVARFHAPRAVEPPLRARSDRRARGRIRIGYLSQDLRDHPVGHVLARALAHHDRSRFEVFVYSWAPEDGSPHRRIVQENVERYVDVSRLSDEAAARAIAGDGVDVLVDLMGHTTGHRLGILARRPAAVQAHWLGYAGTTGAAYIDYFVSDAIATPPSLEDRFTERVVRVRDCFMPSDGTDALAARETSRAEQGLPEDASVFCNFGDTARLTRETFACWMDILSRVEGSLLWLRRTNPLAAENLRAHARARGVDPDRLVFAERVPDKAAHLARVACADLALDTLGWYNGHSTTADLLWAGVPVLTAPGETFASRVAASLVTAAGLTELVVRDAKAYVETAVALAGDRERTRALHRRLLDAREHAPFFDAPRLVGGLEEAYEAMYAGRIPPPAGL